MKFKIFAQFLVLILFFSCTKNSELETALQFAGDNRAELEKVLSHYSKNPADSLKLRAAEFLISNMVYHHTYEHEKLEAYYKEVIAVNDSETRAYLCRAKFDSLGRLYAMPHNELKIKYDILNIKADYLIDNIDLSMNDWHNNPWTQHLTFADFCEYVLPYRIWNEHYEDWRKKMRQRCLISIEWMNNIDDIYNSTYWAARFLNDTLVKNGQHFYSYIKASNLSNPCSVLENIKLGPCDDYVQLTVFAMRSCGIPITIDFTPQWPNRSMGHSWNVLFDESGKEIPLAGGESTNGFPNKPGDIMAKVFRRTYTYQNNSLFHINHSEKIPDLFNTPYIKDVTANYFSTVDVGIELNVKTKNKFAYLAVFNNAQWIPIQWGKINNGNKVEFNAMGKNCVYLPIVYEMGVVKPAAKPFYINNKAQVVRISHKKNMQTITLRRKYPIKRTLYISSRNILGTTILASNSSTFNDSVVQGIIKDDPKFDWDTLQTNCKKKFRYWRIKSSLKNNSNIAELQFIYCNQNITDTSRISSNLLVTSRNKANNLFDNNKLSFVELRRNMNEWISIDFGKPVAVDYFRFLPRNDDNAITPGDSYELMMWGETGWKSLIKCIAKADKLQFKNVPSGGLYLLRNHTKGKEERIFTYENGKQVWW